MPKRRRRPTVLALLAVAAAGIPLAACGDDDDDGGGQAATTPTVAAQTAPPRQAVDTYRAFVVRNAERHLAGFERFAGEVQDGDIAGAKRIYAGARMPWERIEPVAGLFGDLDPALDAREDDVPDETWGGWHYFEKQLWVEETTEDLGRYIAETRADARKLIDVTKTVKLTPKTISRGAVELLDEASSSKITGEEERYSHTDLWDIQANVEGSKAAFAATAPLAGDRTLVADVRSRFAALEKALESYREGNGFTVYTDVSEARRRELSRLIDAAAEPLSRVASKVGRGASAQR